MKKFPKKTTKKTNMIFIEQNAQPMKVLADGSISVLKNI